MEPLTHFHRAQLAAQAGDGGLAIAIWPLFFRHSAYVAGQIQLPPAADALYVAEVAGPPANEQWLGGIYLFRGDPAEPTRARWEARQLAREIKTLHYAWLYRGRIEGSLTRVSLTPLPSWLQQFSFSAGVLTSRWYTTTT